MTKLQLKVGDFLLARTGELMQVNFLDSNTFQFQMYHPKTKERSDFCLEGETAKLDGWIDDVGAKKVSREEAGVQ